MSPPRPSSPTKEGPLAGRALFNALGQEIKRRSPPERARAWLAWAKAIQKGHALHALAQSAIARANECLRLYGKGANHLADLYAVELDGMRGKAFAIMREQKLRPYLSGKRKGAVRKSTRLIAALRRQYPDDSAAELFERLCTHEQFFARDADTIVCRRDGRIIKRRSFASLLSKLPRS